MDITGTDNISLLGFEAQQRIADISDILFDMQNDDLSDRICHMLDEGAARLEAVKIPKATGFRRQVYIMRALDKMSETETEICKLESKLQSDLRELWKTDGKLDCLKSLLNSCFEELRRSLEILTKSYIGAAGEYARLIDRRIKDIQTSELLGIRCGNIIGGKKAEVTTLSQGINTLLTNTFPLWQSQISDARGTASAESINRCIDAGFLAAAALKSAVDEAKKL